MRHLLVGVVCGLVMSSVQAAQVQSAPTAALYSAISAQFPIASTCKSEQGANASCSPSAVTSLRAQGTASAVQGRSPLSKGSPLAGNAMVAHRPWYDTTLGHVGIFIGASLLATTADRSVHRWGVDHQNDSFNRALIHARDVLPWPALWFAAATSIPSPWADSKLAHTSTVAVTSAVITGVEALGLKALIGRNRPNITNDPYSGHPFNSRYSYIYGGSSFPSGHAALTWALITPYAQAYHAPWLYLLGVASAAGRVAENGHWFSDVVGGSLLGYFTAEWTAQHMDSQANFGLIFTGNGIMLFKRF